MARTPRNRNADNSPNNSEETIMLDENPTIDEPNLSEPNLSEPDISDTPSVENSDENPDENPDVNSADNSSETSETSETETTEPVLFQLPEKWEDLTLSEPFAQAFGQKLLLTLGQIKEITELLKAAESGDNSAAIVSYAESDVASETVKAIYGKVSEFKTQFDDAMAQLAEIVKTEKGDVQLSADEIAVKVSERKHLRELAGHALVSFKEFTDDNKAGAEDIKLFHDTIQTIIGTRGRTAKTSGTGTYEQSTSARPRLSPKGEKTGYVEVAGERFHSFTPAMAKIHSLPGGKNINTGQLHEAWIKTALGSSADVNQWGTIPVNSDTDFTVGDETHQIPVKVHFTYVK